MTFAALGHAADRIRRYAVERAAVGIDATNLALGPHDLGRSSPRASLGGKLMADQDDYGSGSASEIARKAAADIQARYGSPGIIGTRQWTRTNIATDET